MLAKFVDDYCLARDLSASYVDQLQRSLRLFAAWLERPAAFEDFADDTLNRFLRERQESVGPATLRTNRGHLLALWRSAYDEGKIDRLPGRIRLPKRIRKEIEGPDRAALRRMLAEARRLPGVNRRTGIPYSRFFVAVIYLCWDCAMRRGDLLSLRKENIRGNMLSKVQNKTGHVHRARLRPVTLKALASIHRGRQFAELLPWRQHLSHFDHMFTRLKRKSGMTMRGNTQAIRRSRATYADQQRAGDGPRILGHKSYDLYERFYRVDRIAEKVPEALDL